MRQHVLFYDDFRDVGGHELMTLNAVRHIARTHRVSFMVYERNRRLLELLSEIDQVRAVPIRYRSRRLQETRNLVSIRAHLAIRSQMLALRPSVVVAIQGRIELSTLGVIAAKTARLPVVSYLPMAHPLQLAGTRLGSSIRERIDSLYYHMPDKFITSNEHARRAIHRRAKLANVALVPNGFDFENCHIVRKGEARSALGIPDDRYVVAVLARLDYRQKGQDVIIEALSGLPEMPKDVHLLFAGDGPDKSDLEKRVARAGLTHRVTLIPWTRDTATVYGASNMIAIPSRYEGYPLVLSEAMYHGLPVIGSRVDAMADVLPNDWLFASGDPRGLLHALMRARFADPTVIAENRRLVVEQHTVERFGMRFEKAVVETST